MIVVDTGAQIGLLDRSDPHHTALVELYKRAPDQGVARLLHAGTDDAPEHLQLTYGDRFLQHLVRRHSERG